MDMEQEFKEEFLELYTEDELDVVYSLIDSCLEDDEKSGVIYHYGTSPWTASQYVERQGSLQYTHDITVHRDSDQQRIELVYENGINNGTQLNDYEFISMENNQFVITTPKIYIDGTVEMMTIRKKFNTPKGECQCLLEDRTYVKERNCFPYGDDIEYDLCNVCGKKHNFSCLT